ncbi:hypothetical protein HDU97_008403 [Phlyctochytrium planicorne]|nr:hypothetical protein HDU97_008403 [Phlyctochytrium planicorne]
MKYDPVPTSIPSDNNDATSSHATNSALHPSSAHPPSYNPSSIADPSAIVVIPSGHSGTPPSFEDALGVPKLFIPECLQSEESLLLMNVSKAKFGKIQDCVISSDKLLQDTDELLKFFLTHLSGSAPMAIHIHGMTGIRTDFNFSVDVSQFVTPEWVPVFEPSLLDRIRNGGRSAECEMSAFEFRDVLEQWTNSWMLSKSLSIGSKIEWDYDELALALTNAIKATGYAGTVSIHFDHTPSRKKVTATLHSPYHFLLFFAAFMIGSYIPSILATSYFAFCMILTFSVLMMGGDGFRRKVFARYEMGVGTREFYERNVEWILLAARLRSNGGVIVAV